MPSISKIGVNTATSERLIDTTVKPTSFAPISAASPGDLPSSIWRAMFSSTTTASSTTKPVAMVSAIRLMLLSEKSSRYITAKVPTSDTGTVSAGIMVARQLRKNRNTTITTKHTDSSKACSTSRSEARMVGLRSKATLILIAAGISSCKRGTASRTRSTVSMILAPGWRKITSMMAGSLFSKPILSELLTLSSTLATSDNRIAAPF